MPPTVCIVGARERWVSVWRCGSGRRACRSWSARATPRAQQETVSNLREHVPDGSFQGYTNEEAATKAEIVLLSVPFRTQSETMTHLKDVLKPGQLLVDATVPLAAAVSGKATRTLGVWQGSAAQAAQEMAPDGVRVVAAFHTVSAALLRDLEHELDEDVLICGDSREDKDGSPSSSI